MKEKSLTGGGRITSSFLYPLCLSLKNGSKARVDLSVSTIEAFLLPLEHGIPNRADQL